MVDKPNYNLIKNNEINITHFYYVISALAKTGFFQARDRQKCLGELL